MKSWKFSWSWHGTGLDLIAAIARIGVAIALVAFLAQAPACGLFGGKGSDSSALIQKTEALAFAGAVAALEVLDRAEAEHLASIPKATPEELAKERATVDRLKRARDALAIVREVLSGETKGDERAEFRVAVDALTLAAQELESRGVTIPDSARDGLKAAKAFLGEK